MNEIVNKNIGHATAYGYAKSKGYTGTEEQFAELMASYADVGQTAVDAALRAKASEDAAKASETASAASQAAAATSAVTASTAAQNAAQSAQAAQADADAAALDASQALSAASTAGQKATEAAQSATAAAGSATTAGTAATAAQTAQTAAETAQGKAEDAQAAAEAAAQTLVIDPTLTQANQAAEAKATGDAISLVKSQLEAIIEDNYENVTVEKDVSIDASRNSGYVDIYGTVQTNSSYVYSQKISVGEGDTITGVGIDTNYNIQTALAMQRICAYNNGVAVSSAGVSSYVLTYTVPQGINEIVISYLAAMTDVVINRHALNYIEKIPKVDELEKAIDILADAEEKITVSSVDPVVVSGKYISLNGNESTNSSYYYFIVENLKEGDVISARSFYGQSTSIVIPYFRYVCAYNSINQAVQTKGVENALGTYTVPTGITKIAVSIQATYPIADGVLIYRENDVTDIKVNENLDSVAFASYPQSINGILSASSTLTLTTNSVKKNKEIIFNAKISAFSKIIIGQGTNDLNSARYEIDGTNVTYYRGTASTGVEHAHGLTFTDYISVTISVNEEHVPTITVMTNGGMFNVTESATWVGCMPNVYVTSDGSTTLTECVLSFVCNDIKEPLWIFGDSYVSYTSDRWTYYVSQMGYNRYLLNGYSGEDAAHAMQDLRDLLDVGTPKYIVWGLGMNNADLTDQVERVWNAVYTELKALCTEKKITLILCTIPNVPGRSHTYKNSIIMNSGYKYINFADAVGALDDSTWYTGMLSSDNLHPSAEGGKALAAEVFKDFPYICIK